ncbi:hypothetical protein CLU79DRAFT_831698 [Phycomyces nitens]|nr:hypothetical protein CLU79DRAFT_831698 [Phycomyces nitens]
MQLYSLTIALAFFAALVQAGPLPIGVSDDSLARNSEISAVSFANPALNTVKKRKFDIAPSNVDLHVLGLSKNIKREVSPAGLLEDGSKIGKDGLHDPLNGKRGRIGTKIHEDIKNREKDLAH